MKKDYFSSHIKGVGKIILPRYHFIIISYKNPNIYHVDIILGLVILKKISYFTIKSMQMPFIYNYRKKV